MEDQIPELYNDRWQKFIKRSLRNIDYFDYPLSNEIIEFFLYKMDRINIPKGETFMKAGKPTQ
jgi:hypothetical protein